MSSSASPEMKQPAHFIKPRTPPRNAKRKRDDVEDQDHGAVLINIAKRKKSKKSERRNSEEHQGRDVNRSLNLAIAKLDKRLLTDYIAKQTKRFFPDLSLVELEDRYIPGILGS